jgi:hypothetical protein
MAAQTRYETRTFDLAKLEGVDVFISHFDDFEGLAHIFLSFGFSDGEQVVVSLETRREADEEFSPSWAYSANSRSFTLSALNQTSLVFAPATAANVCISIRPLPTLRSPSPL